VEGWADDVLNAVEADEDVIQWALSAFEVTVVHKDAFNNILETATKKCLHKH
jgi:hypothetical protein